MAYFSSSESYGSAGPATRALHNQEAEMLVSSMALFSISNSSGNCKSEACGRSSSFSSTNSQSSDTSCTGSTNAWGSSSTRQSYMYGLSDLANDDGASLHTTNQNVKMPSNDTTQMDVVSDDLSLGDSW
eukprot:CAMPEP_0197453832 /NCGR_PEP_ID=MMETSP1175-20131217/36138_1 /TAXON_ID=1003142 /ORGANISM="Triceratium dubium, Strain CCMP147" /LENGTH=128 /DNA_ID=CAMNT_0042987235 /DNA_START=198 /DNA_END=581 /DNA_ORIENTATION=+